MPQQTGPSVDLMEHQAKELFALHGVPVLPGETVDTAEAARGVAERIGRPVVVKAQVKTGGRGKAGGVKLAATPDEAVARAHDILGLDIKGHVVHKVLVTEASEIDVEYYVAFLLDRASRAYLAMASAEGGMEIEQLAVERPDALARIPVDPIRGCDEAKAREIVAAARIPVDVADEVAGILLSMWQLFIEQEATLVEINPLCRTPDGRIVALDGKVTLDGNAEFRHADVFAAYADVVAADDLEGRARSKGLNYVKLDGEVGIIGNGAGLVMSTLDVVAYAGAGYPGPHGSGIRPANFLDIGGGASAQVMADGLGIILSDPDVRSVFVNVFGGITSCDAVATGIVTALGILGEQATKPLVVRLDGNNVEQGRRILAEAAHPLVTVVDTMDGAAARAAELASGVDADADADADANRQR